jgi:hypothetical protein
VCVCVCIYTGTCCILGCVHLPLWCSQRQPTAARFGPPVLVLTLLASSCAAAVQFSSPHALSLTRTAKTSASLRVTSTQWERQLFTLNEIFGMEKDWFPFRTQIGWCTLYTRINIEFFKLLKPPNQEDRGSEPVWAYSLWDPISKNLHKNRGYEVAQGKGPEFKTSAVKKNIGEQEGRTGPAWVGAWYQWEGEGCGERV